MAEQIGWIELLYSISDNWVQQRVFADLNFFRVQFRGASRAERTVTTYPAAQQPEAACE